MTRLTCSNWFEIPITLKILRLDVNWYTQILQKKFVSPMGTRGRTTTFFFPVTMILNAPDIVLKLKSKGSVPKITKLIIEPSRHVQWPWFLLSCYGSHMWWLITNAMKCPLWVSMGKASIHFYREDPEKIWRCNYPSCWSIVLTTCNIFSPPPGGI